ncbi:hypothetical protein IAT38_004181 [Cryptococcus sp. DSM 104549]
MPAPVMSQLENTSAILGEYMLKGWTLTDLHCSECKTTPLMREPAAAAQREGRERVQFCALCDGRPEGRVIPPPAPAPTVARVAAPEATASSTAQSSKKEEEVAEPDPAESISNLLLRGYSLLGETCRTPACRAIPLVGYPRKPDGSKDGRKMCVSCGGRWVAEGQIGEGWSVGSAAGAGEGQGKGKAGEAERAGAGESPRSRKRRELYGIEADGSASVVSATAAEGKGKGKGKAVDAGEFEKHARQSEGKLVGKPAGAAVEEDEDDDLEEEEEKPKATGPATMKSATAARSTIPPMPMPIPHVPHNPPVAPAPESQLGQALATTSDSLSSTLQSLSASLERYAAHPRATARQAEDAGRWFVDLKLHTEAIKDVMGVIAQVERAKRVGY